MVHTASQDKEIEFFGSVSVAIQKFIDELDLDTDTRKAYELDLLAFEAFLLKEELSIENVGKDSIKNHLDNLRTKREGKRVSYTTQNRHYATLRRFFSWLVQEGFIEYNPMLNLNRRKPNKDNGEVPSGSIIKALEKEQIESIVTNSRTLQEKALFLLIYTTGLRISEALNLKVEDIHNDTILVRSTKGNRPRKTFISKNYKSILRRYLKEYKLKAGWLFPSSVRSDRPLSYGRARQLFNRAAESCINPDGSRVTIHQLRHTFATERAGYIDSILLMELMGHSDIRTTLRYAKVTGNAAKQAFEMFEQRFANLNLSFSSSF